jgi:radical SAM protein with 4Fe4S-binding SPASM domain
MGIFKSMKKIVQPNQKYICSDPPNHVQIEITSRCNILCYMCPRETLGFKNRNLPDISLEAFKTIIDKLPDGIKVVSLHGLGEPLINKGIFEMIKYARNRFGVLLVTNGTILDEIKVNKLFESPPSEMIISIDSPYKAEYEAIRRGANFNTVVKNIELIEKTRKEKAPNLRFSLQMTVSESNFNQIQDMIKLCRNLGVENLSLIGIHTYKNDKIIDEFKDYETKLKAIRDCADSNNINLFLINMEHQPKQSLCNRSYNTLFINSDGFVNPCCIHETTERQIIGNILESSFERIWNGNSMKKFRRNLESENKPLMCSKCDRLYS